MHHELLAKERQAMKEHIKKLETQLKDMHSDFEQCAKGALPCFYCDKTSTCSCRITDCNFIWKPHN